MFEQERMIGRLQRKVAADKTIQACFLSGSFGRNTSDSFSDLDVTLVFESEDARELAWVNRKQFAESLMPYLAFKSVVAQYLQPYLYIALYANGSKIDFLYESKGSLSPNPWNGQIRILKDENEWVHSFQEKSALLAFPRPQINNKDLAAVDQRFWIMFWDVVRQLARGDSKAPFSTYLLLLQSTFPPLLNALPQDHSARDMLVTVHYDLDSEKTLREMYKLMEAYLTTREAIVNIYHLQFTANKGFESEILKLLAKLT